MRGGWKMKVNNGTEDYLLAFFSLYETSSEDVYIGSILVTNTQTIPLEFRCTHSVKPNIIQKTLYGKMLKKFIGIKLCGIQLLKSLQNSPKLMIVNKDFLLDIRKEVNYPVLYVRREENIDLTIDDGSLLKRKRLESPTESFNPVIITYYQDFDDDMVIDHIVENILYSFDPIEPFERMNNAIEILRKEDKRFQ